LILKKNSETNKTEVLPDALMYFDTIVGNNLVKQIPEEISPNIIYNKCIITDTNGQRHEDYWIIKPNIVDTPIDLTLSDYRIDNVIDKPPPSLINIDLIKSNQIKSNQIKSKTIQKNIH
jgi:hypothetical protein